MVGLAGLSTAAAGETTSGWRVVDSPTGNRLHGVAQAVDGPWAVGGNGVLLERGFDGTWSVVLRNGPTGNGNNLRTISATDDGRRVWFAGASGVIGEYDVVTETLYSHSSPQDITDTWEGIAVQGVATKSEHVYLVNGSGAQFTGVRTGDGSIEWRELKKPGSGSSIPAIDFYDLREGYFADTNQLVAFDRDAGKSWRRVGIENTDENFYAVAAAARDDVNVGGGDGTMFHYDSSSWRRLGLADHALRGIDRDGALGLASDAGGNVYERQAVGRWTKMDTPTDDALFDVARVADGADVALGENGTIVERP